MIEASESSEKKLTDDEITGNAFVFILAGYETTATSLSFTSYLIAAHPEVQEKLHAEIDAEISDDVRIFNFAALLLKTWKKHRDSKSYFDFWN